MTKDENHKVPEAFYGVLRQDKASTDLHEVAEQVRRLGYAVLSGGYAKHELSVISDEFELARARYISQWGEQRLRSINEINTIRAPILHGGHVFTRLATNERLLSVIKMLVVGEFILNQQNGIINPPKQEYNQGQWHRDLPYQHYISSVPLAVNALYCVDEFTVKNGATFVLPATHKSPDFPTMDYVRNNAIQVEAKPGDYIVLDCMLFHCGGYNTTSNERRGVNHVFTIPFLKQQINLPSNLDESSLSTELRRILGFPYKEPSSIEEYLLTREKA